MPHRRLLQGIISAVLVAGAPTAAWAATGYVTTYDVTATDAAGQAKSGAYVMTLAPGHARVESTAEQTVTLFDFNGQVIWLLDESRRTAMRVELTKMMQQLHGSLQQQGVGSLPAEAQAALQESLKDLPPEAQAAMAQLTQQGSRHAVPAAQAPATAHPTGEQRIVNGVPCAVYATSSPLVTMTECWSEHVPPGANDPAYLQLAEQFKRFSEPLQQLGQLGLPTADTANDPHAKQFLVHMDSRMALPVGGHAMTQQLTYRRFEARGDLTPDLFEVPAGYQRVEMDQPEHPPGSGEGLGQ